jgi:hypothetical protein
MGIIFLEQIFVGKTGSGLNPNLEVDKDESNN